MRDMRNPGSVRLGGTPLPDHYADFKYMRDDNGGVHVNSSIINQGFYLLAEGGRHSRRRGPAVEGIGVLQAMRIFGMAATSLLTPNSDFEDARYAFADVAEALHGSGSSEWIATHTAMDAIGIPGDWELPPPLDPPPPDPVPPPTPASLPEPPDPPPPDPVPPPTPASLPEPPDPPPPDPVPPPTPASLPEPPDPPPPDPVLSSQAALVFGLIIGLAVMGAAVLLVTRRRAGASSGRERWNDDQADRRRNAPNRNVPAVPVPPPAHEDILGTLHPADGSASIPLPRALLSSREGLVIGRDSALCHMEIRDSAVSRRHVRLRMRGWDDSGGRPQLPAGNVRRGHRPEAVRPPAGSAPGQTLSIAGRPYRITRGGR